MMIRLPKWLKSQNRRNGHRRRHHRRIAIEQLEVRQVMTATMDISFAANYQGRENVLLATDETGCQRMIEDGVVNWQQASNGDVFFFRWESAGRPETLLHWDSQSGKSIVDDHVAVWKVNGNSATYVQYNASTGAITLNGSNEADRLRAVQTGQVVSIFLGNAVEGASSDSEVISFDTGRVAVNKLIFRGNAGNDLIENQTSVAGEIYGGDGNDTITGGAVIDLIYGNFGRDEIHGGNGDDVIHGDDGNDILFGENGNDSLYGGDGHDQLYGDIYEKPLFRENLSISPTLEDLRELLGDMTGEFSGEIEPAEPDLSEAALLSVSNWSGSDMRLDHDSEFLGSPAIDGFDATAPGEMVSASRDYTSEVDRSQLTNGQFVFSFAAYASSGEDGLTESHNSGVGLNLQATWWSNKYSGGWKFDVGSLTGNPNDSVLIEGGYDKVSHFEIVFDYETAEVYGRYDFGDGFQETKHFSCDPAQFAQFSQMVVTQDWRDGSGGIQVADLALKHITGFSESSLETSNDRLEGGAGNDLVRGGVGRDELFGGSGNDEIFIDQQDSTVHGETGDDHLTVTGTEHSETWTFRGDSTRLWIDSPNQQWTDLLEVESFTVDAKGGNDAIYNDTYLSSVIYGGTGEDTITGGHSADIIYGGADDDFIRGRGSNDAIYGQSGDDRIYSALDDSTDNYFIGEYQRQGQTGSDLLDGGKGHDTLDGSTDVDGYYSFGDTLTILGTDANNTLTLRQNDGFLYLDGVSRVWQYPETVEVHGLKGDDTIRVESGVNSVLIGGEGADSLTGGGGNDLISIDVHDRVADGREGQNAVMLTGTEQRNDWIFRGDTNVLQVDSPESWIDLLNFHSIIADVGEGDDVVYNDTSLSSVIYGGGGSDTITGGSSQDVIYGGSEDDFIRGRGADDIINGGSGNDELYGHLNDAFDINSKDSIFGDDGLDILEGTKSLDGIAWNDGILQLWGTIGNDQIELWTNDGKVFLDVGVVGESLTRLSQSWAMPDRIEVVGGKGNDVLTNRTFANPVVFLGGEGADVLTGGESDDILVGGAGADELYGRSGNDILYGDREDARIEGESGNDSAIRDERIGYNKETGVVSVIGNDEAEHLESEFSDDQVWFYFYETYDGVTSKRLGGVFDTGYTTVNHIEFFGNDGDDQFTNHTHISSMMDGGKGFDTLIGGSGDDTFVGRGEGEHFEGGGGTNTLDYSNYGQGVWVELNRGITRNMTHLGTNIDTHNNIWNIVGTNFDDKLEGDEHNNQIVGGFGNDEIFGLSGNDVLVGGDGDDKIWGHDGADMLYGGPGYDAIDGGGGDWIDLAFEGETVGNTSKLAAFAATDDGWFALTKDKDSAVWRYASADAGWHKITGNDISTMVAVDGHIFALANNAQTGNRAVWRYTGQGEQWDQVTGSDVNMMVEANGELFVLPDNRAVWKYNKTTGEFDQITGFDVNALMAVNNQVFILPDNRAVWKYTGHGNDWEQITGFDVNSVFAVGDDLYVLPDNRAIFKYNGVGADWNQITAFDVKTMLPYNGKLYALPDNGALWEYDGVQWSRITHFNIIATGVDADERLIVITDGDDAWAHESGANWTLVEEDVEQIGYSNQGYLTWKKDGGFFDDLGDFARDTLVPVYVGFISGHVTRTGIYGGAIVSSNVNGISYWDALRNDPVLKTIENSAVRAFSIASGGGFGGLLGGIFVGAGTASAITGESFGDAMVNNAIFAGTTAVSMLNVNGSVASGIFGGAGTFIGTVGVGAVTGAANAAANQLVYALADLTGLQDGYVFDPLAIIKGAGTGGLVAAIKSGLTELFGTASATTTDSISKQLGLGNYGNGLINESEVTALGRRISLLGRIPTTNGELIVSLPTLDNIGHVFSQGIQEVAQMAPLLADASALGKLGILGAWVPGEMTISLITSTAEVVNASNNGTLAGAIEAALKTAGASVFLMYTVPAASAYDLGAFFYNLVDWSAPVVSQQGFFLYSSHLP